MIEKSKNDIKRLIVESRILTQELKICQHYMKSEGVVLINDSVSSLKFISENLLRMKRDASES